MSTTPRTIKSLELNRETIQDLTEMEAEQVEGGWSTRPQFTWSCPQPRLRQATDLG